MTLLEMPAPAETSPRADAPGLPAWLETPEDIGGEIAVACVSRRAEREILRHLHRERLDYYFPVERVVKWYDGRKREWDRAFFPGRLFIGQGAEGKVAVADYCRFFGWPVGWIGARDQDRLRRELSSLQTVLRFDPTLHAYQGLHPGMPCVVIVGAFRGAIGHVESEGNRHTLWVRITVLGQSIPVQVAPEMLSRI